jgi:hypothetical protein
MVTGAKAQIEALINKMKDANAIINLSKSKAKALGTEVDPTKYAASKELITGIQGSINEAVTFLLSEESGSEQTDFTEVEIATRRVELFIENGINNLSNNDRELMQHISENNLRIIASDGYVYETAELLHTVSEALAGNTNINSVTRSCGLRKKVEEIIEIRNIEAR